MILTRIHNFNHGFSITFSFSAGKIAAGVLVPVFVIAAVLGFLYYRRYKQRLTEEDRVGIIERVHFKDDAIETNFERQPKSLRNANNN